MQTSRRNVGPSRLYGFQLFIFGCQVLKLFLNRSLVLYVRLAGMLFLLEWVAQANSLLHDWLLLSLDTRFSRSLSQGKGAANKV